MRLQRHSVRRISWQQEVATALARSQICSFTAARSAHCPSAKPALRTQLEGGAADRQLLRPVRVHPRKTGIRAISASPEIVSERRIGYPFPVRILVNLERAFPASWAALAKVRGGRRRRGQALFWRMAGTDEHSPLENGKSGGGHCKGMIRFHLAEAVIGMSPGEATTAVPARHAWSISCIFSSACLG